MILRELGDLVRFPTLDEAARHMEPVEVRHGEWTAWDVTGRVLSRRSEQTRRGRSGAKIRGRDPCEARFEREAFKSPDSNEDHLVFRTRWSYLESQGYLQVFPEARFAAPSRTAPSVSYPCFRVDSCGFRP
jgi:hypothetical protein